jgi:hypothetical protein
MFKAIYEGLCGPNNDPSYASGIYNFVGLSTLIFSIVIAAFFYILLGKWKNVWYTRKHWFITFGMLIITSFVWAMLQGKFGTEQDKIDYYMVMFGFTNAMLASIIFFVASLIFKNFSIYSKRTPF